MGIYSTRFVNLNKLSLIKAQDPRSLIKCFKNSLSDMLVENRINCQVEGIKPDQRDYHVFKHVKWASAQENLSLVFLTIRDSN